jgi:ammonium transporter Rh
MGTIADHSIQPAVAMAIGAIAGLISVCGIEYLKPFMRDRLKTPDSCGIANLHGMPGILSGLICALRTLIFC